MEKNFVANIVRAKKELWVEPNHFLNTETNPIFQRMRPSRTLDQIFDERVQRVSEELDLFLEQTSMQFSGRDAREFFLQRNALLSGLRDQKSDVLMDNPRPWSTALEFACRSAEEAFDPLHPPVNCGID